VRDDGAVLLLLPPSEAKLPGGDGPSLDELDRAVASGSLGGSAGDAPLRVARRAVLSAVAAFCTRTPRKARIALKLPPGSAAGDLAANVAARHSPTMPAFDRFTGVLYTALDVSTLTVAERRRAERSTLVFSGAFGVLAGDEPVPVHRVPASATVPRVGGLATYWKKALGPALLPRVDTTPLVVDLRSSDYAAMWQPSPEHAARVVAVRVLEDRGGVLRSVSWSAKHGKGLLARELLRTDTVRRPVHGVGQVADAGRRLGYDVAERPVASGGTALDLIVRG
jgi:hypothetical protein